MDNHGFPKPHHIFLLVVCSSDKEIRIRTETYRENFDGLYRKPYYYTAAGEQSFAAFSYSTN